MKTFWWLGLVSVLAGCNSSGGGGSESNFVTCTTSRDCTSGFVCAAGACQRLDASASSGGASPVEPSSGGARSTGGMAGNAGAGGFAGSAGAQSTGGSNGSKPDAAPPGTTDAGRDGSASVDGGANDAGLDASTACFDVAPAVCGAISGWTPTVRNGGWSVYRAIPIEGADGFAALLAHSTSGTYDAYAFATLDAAGGCANLVAPQWGPTAAFAGVYRAVSRGGTFALVGECVQRFLCGATLFLNGAEWSDPRGTAYLVDVDVAGDGRVLMISGGYPSADAATSQELVERWLSPGGEILTERRYSGLGADDVAVLDDGTVALAANDASGSYVQFQSADLENVDVWRPGTNLGVFSLGYHAPWLAVGGQDNGSHPLTGVLNAQTHAEVWSRVRSDLMGDAVGVEVDATGTVNASVWQGPFGFASFLLLHDSKTAQGSATATYDPHYPGGPTRMNSFAGIRTQADGEILFSTDFAGTYCESD